MLGRPVLHADVEIGDAVRDVVAYQSHSFDAVDAALRGFVGAPSFRTWLRHRLDMGFASEWTTTST